MRTSRYSDSQILAILKQNESGVSVPDLCREHGMSSAMFYKWRAKYRRHGCVDDEASQRTGRREQASQEDVCRGKAQGGDPPGSPRGKVITPSQRREMAITAKERYGVSVRFACHCLDRYWQINFSKPEKQSLKTQATTLLQSANALTLRSR